MLSPGDQLSMCATVIVGEKGKDDFVVVWNAITVGRILRVAGVGGSVWNWGVAFPHWQQLPAHRRQAGDVEERKQAVQGRLVGDPSRADGGRHRDSAPRPGGPSSAGREPGTARFETFKPFPNGSARGMK